MAAAACALNARSHQAVPLGLVHIVRPGHRKCCPSIMRRLMIGQAARARWQTFMMPGRLWRKQRLPLTPPMGLPLRTTTYWPATMMQLAVVCSWQPAAIAAVAPCSQSDCPAAARPPHCNGHQPALPADIQMYEIPHYVSWKSPTAAHRMLYAQNVCHLPYE